MLEQLVKLLMAQDDTLTESTATAKAKEMLASATKPLEDKVTELQAQVTAESGKAAGILEDKKKLQTKVEELSSKVEELTSSSLSADEKTQRELEKTQKALFDAKEQAKQYELQIQKAERTHKLDQIASKFKFVTTLPEGAGRLWVENEFGGIDLKNEQAIEAQEIMFRDKYQNMLVSDDVPSGSGGDGKGGANPKPNAGDRKKQLETMDPKARQKELRGMR